MTIKWTLQEVQAAINTFPIHIFDQILDDVIILGILRGGLIPSALLVKPLKVDHNVVSPRINTIQLKEKIGTHRYVIFIDDINDSGATIDWFIHLMGKTYPDMPEPMFQFWTLIKRNTTRHPEITAGVTIDKEDWVEFPWDKDEPHQRTNEPSNVKTD